MKKANGRRKWLAAVLLCGICTASWSAVKADSFDLENRDIHSSEGGVIIQEEETNNSENNSTEETAIEGDDVYIINPNNPIIGIEGGINLYSLDGVVNGFYYEKDQLVKGKGIIEFEGSLYFVRNDGSIYTNGKLKITEAKANGLIAAGTYLFDENGRLFTGIKDGYYFENGVIVKGKGIVEFKGEIYFVRTDGSIYTNGKLKITEAKANGLIAAGTYLFDEDGRLFTGIKDGYYYEAGLVVKSKGIVEFEGNLYFVRNDGSTYKNGRLKVTEAKVNGLIAAGAYTFDADGILIK